MEALGDFVQEQRLGKLLLPTEDCTSWQTPTAAVAVLLVSGMLLAEFASSQAFWVSRCCGPAD